MYQEDSGKVVEVLNEHEYISTSTIDNMFKVGYTTKVESGHGYGLFNLNRIVNRNKGRYVISNKTVDDSNFFSVKLIFS